MFLVSYINAVVILTIQFITCGSLQTSNFADHFYENNNKFAEMEETEILHLANKGRNMDILEAIEVHKNLSASITTLLNEQTDLWKSLLFNRFRTYIK